MTRHLATAIRVGVLVATFLLPAVAQQNPNLEQGLKPYGSYQGGNIDAVSLTNGNLSLQIPLVSYPQRGGKLVFAFFIRYNNKGWQGQLYTDSMGVDHIRWMWKGSGVEVARDQVIKLKTQTIKVQPLYDPFAGPVWVSLSDAITADGSSHQLETTGTAGESVDASGIRSDSGVLIDRGGIRYAQNAPGKDVNVEDPNGNKITASASGWTDTLGRLIPGSIPSDATYGSNLMYALAAGVPTTDFSGCPSGTVAARIWNLPGPNGGTSPIKMCWASYTIQSNFGISWIQETSATVRFLNGVILPNQTKWLFSYNSTGDLTQVSFPTGGTLSYTWGNVTTCNGALGTTPVSRGVATRTLDANDGTGAKTWNYSVSFTSTVVTDPAGNDSVHYHGGVGGICSLYETKAEYFQGSRTSGTLLKTVTTEYSGNPNPRVIYTDEELGMNVVPIRTTTTWPNGKVSQTTRQYDSGNTFTFYDAFWDTWTNYPLVYGSVLQATASDYGLTAPGPILRKTLNSYVWTSNANYKSRNMLDLVTSVTVQDGAGMQIARTEYAYDETTPVASGITTQHNVPPSVGDFRGNLSSVKRWLNTTGALLTSPTTFYDTGMPYQTTDPGGHTTTFTYSPTFAGAYVTQTQFPSTSSPNPANHVISGNYNFNTGLLTSFTDENGQTSTYAYDSMWRITTAIFPPQNGLNGQTNFYYPDPVTVELQKRIDGTRWTDLYIRFDGLGRETRRISANDETAPWDHVDTCYDARGYKGFVSYPYQGSGLSAPPVCSGAGDSFTYDALGRVTAVTHSDGTSVLTNYAGPATRVTDEGNGTTTVQRISQVDGLGRVTAMCEVTGTTLIGITGTPSPCGLDIAATGFLTSYGYQYDLSGNLLFTVQQGGLNPRSAVYDSLSRVTEAFNPESGTINYTYDPDGLLVSRLAPAPNQTNPSVKVTALFTYDELHRVRTRTYQNDSSGTPSATFNYDQASALGVALSNSLGRASSSYVTNAQGQILSAEVFSYDGMGRVRINSQCTPQNCPSAVFPLSYDYDLVGNILSATNGTGVTLTYFYNRAARLTALTSSLADANHPAMLLSGVHYNAFGGHTSASLGNAVNESLGYDPRGRLQSLNALKDTTTVYSFSLGYAGNSNVLTANDSVNGNWTYGYDEFNRLIRATPSGQTYWYTYDYDRFGNRWHQSLGGTGGPPGNVVDLAFGANNRIAPGNGVSYDAAGNVTNDGDSSYTYDAENRIITVSGSKGTGSYVYNAAGLRIRKTTPSGAVDYLYDLGGHVITEVNASGAWTRVEVYAGSRHIATYKDGPAGQTYFSHADWLGTERARTGMTGTTPVETCTSLPFGDGQTCTGTDVSPIHFTGKERDSESDNDYFGARYYISRHGRWLTPDWSARQEAVPYADLANPQTLNLYAYVGNNPVSHTDSDGHAPSTSVPGVGYWWKGETLVSVGSSSLDATFASIGPQLMTESQEEAQNQDMSLSSEGLDFIKKYEELRLKTYKDQAGYETIGYGHKVLPGEDFSKGITEAQALDLLKQDVQSTVNAVNAGLKDVKASVKQNQFDALVSLAYNAGSGSVQAKNQMMQAIKAGKLTEGNFTAYRWIHVNGKPVESTGLLRRRKAEYVIWSEGRY